MATSKRPVIVRPAPKKAAKRARPADPFVIDNAPVKLVREDIARMLGIEVGQREEKSLRTQVAKHVAELLEGDRVAGRSSGYAQASVINAEINSAEKARESVLFTVIASLERRIEEAHHGLAALEESLATVLLPEPPQPIGAGQTQSAESPLESAAVMEISRLASVVDRLTVRMNTVRGRVQA